MIKSLLEAFPKLKAGQYETILKMIKQYVYFRYPNLPDIERESMMDEVIDKVFDSLDTKNMTPDNTDPVVFRGFVKRAVNFATDGYYYYHIRTRLPKKLTFEKFKELSNRMNLESEKELFRRLYTRKNELGVYKKKDNIDPNDRNALEDVFHKYSFEIHGDALQRLANPTGDAEGEAEDMIDTAIPASYDTEEEFLNKEYSVRFDELLVELGYDNKQIKLINLLRMHNVDYGEVAGILLRDKKLAKTMLPTNPVSNRLIISYTLDNVRIYIVRLMENLQRKVTENPELVKQKGLDK